MQDTNFPALLAQQAPLNVAMFLPRASLITPGQPARLDWMTGQPIPADAVSTRMTVLTCVVRPGGRSLPADAA